MIRTKNTDILLMRYCYLSIAILGVGTWLYLSFYPNSKLTVNNELINADYLNSSPFLLFGLIFIIPFYLLRGKFVSIKFSDERIWIKKNGLITEYDWKDIEQLSMKRSFLPGIYRIKLINESIIYFFSSGKKAWSFPFAPIDNSALGEFVSKKKELFDIPD